VHTALNNLDTNTYKGDNLLLINDNNILNIICFSTKSNLEFLCSCDKIFVDGTFDFCSKYFYQLFTIHGLKNGYYISLVFSLLLNKLSTIYEYLFRVLIVNVQHSILILIKKQSLPISNKLYILQLNKSGIQYF